MTSSISLYIGLGPGSNPNRFHYDDYFKAVEAKKAIVLGPSTLPGITEAGGFVVTIEVHGYDTGRNQPIDNLIEITTQVGESSASVQLDAKNNDLEA